MRSLVLSLALVACVVGPPAVRAQRTPVPSEPADAGQRADVLARLRSERWADLAQGGYLAGAHQVHDAVPWLRGALARVREPKTLAQRLTALALLDGLIRLNATVPAAEVEPFLGGMTLGSALVLLAQRPRESAGVLLTFFRGAEAPEGRLDDAWIAAGNLLARARAPGFASAALVGLELVLEVHVRRPDEEGWATVVSSCIGVGCGGPAIPDGFPPAAIYRLGTRPATGGWRLLAPGRPTVSYLRTLVRRRGAWPSSHHRGVDAHAQRLIWLGELAGAPPLDARTRVDLVRWSDERLRADLACERENLVGRYRRLIEALVLRGQLPAAERAREAPLRIAWHPSTSGPEPLPPPPEGIIDPLR